MRKRTIGIATIAITLLAMTLVGGSAALGNKQPSQTPSLTIAVSIVPQVEWVQEVGGSHVAVQALIPAGQSPHTYNPTTTELTFVATADAWFQIGLTTFEKVHNNTIVSENPSMEVVNLSQFIDILKMGEHSYAPIQPSNGEEDDPHTWLSLTRAIIMVQKINDTLCALDQANAGDYSANAAAYISRLTAVNASIASALASPRVDDMLVFHPAWGYFCDDFGLDQHALESEGKDPTSAHFAEIIEKARNKSIGAIFIQEEFSLTVAQAFAEEACVELVRLYPLTANYSDNMNYTGHLVAEKLNQEPVCPPLIPGYEPLVIAIITFASAAILITLARKRITKPQQ